jgi:diaminopimelate decarboxylase
MDKNYNMLKSEPDKNFFNTFIDVSTQETIIGSHPLIWWIDNFQLPLHIYYAPQIRNNLKAFKKVFDNYYPNGFVCYAAKACTHPEVFKLMVEMGAGSDVASENETLCALESGIPPGDLMLNGNCKEDSLIELAIQKDIPIVADSIEEYKLISQIADRLGKNAKTLLRLSGFDLSNVTATSIFTAGNWTKFGTHLSLVPAFLKNLNSYPHVELLGLHVHIGSQITELEPYLVVLGKMIELGHLLKGMGKDCKMINLGGGYPVSYVGKEEWEQILDRIRKGYIHALNGDMSKLFVWDNGTSGFAVGSDGKVNLDKWIGEKFFTFYPKEKMLEGILKGTVNVNGKMLNSIQAIKELGEPKIVIEPGRSIVEDSAITLAKVGHVRKIAEYHNLVTLEMGITSLGLAMLVIPINHWTIINDYNKKDDVPFETFIGGNLCFSGDMISKYKVLLQRKPQRGDILLIQDTGAYNPNFFASNPNSFPRPARVLVNEAGNISIMKKRDTFREIFSM